MSFELSRRGFLAAATAATIPGAVLAGKTSGGIARTAAAGAKIGALGKIVGELPQGRYDSHIHVMGGEPDPEKLFNSFKAAGLAGGCIFSQPPRKTNRAIPDPLPPEKAMEDCIRWASASPTIYPFYYIDPTAPDALELVDMAVAKGFYGFKVIRNDGYPCDEKTIPVYQRIAHHDKPVTFHTGILWDGCDSSSFFRPTNWEGLLACPKLRFALCHISWPWCDECIAVYGKFLNAITRNGWQNVPEMFIDTTPGTPKIYRKDALSKIYTVGYDVMDHVMFGTDCRVSKYNVNWAKDWLATDDGIYDGLALDARMRDSAYRTSLQRYLFGGDNSNRKAPTADGLPRPKV
jgi:hypothetical protein